jgi:hypothetical protein
VAGIAGGQERLGLRPGSCGLRGREPAAEGVLGERMHDHSALIDVG